MVGRLAAAVVVIALAGGCIVEKPAPPTVYATVSVPFEVGAAQPVVVRALRFQADPGTKRLREIELFGATQPTQGEPYLSDVWTSFVDVRTGRLPGPIPSANVTVGGSRYNGVCPVAGCDVTWVVITRAMDTMVDPTRTGVLLGGLSAHARDEPRPSDPPFGLDVFSVTEVDPPATPIPLAAASLTGAARLEPGDPVKRRTVRILIDRAIVELPRAFPQVGRIAYFGTGPFDDRPSTIRADVVLAGAMGAAVRESKLGGIFTPATNEIDLLSLCPVSGTCAIDVAMSWSLNSTDARRSAPLDHGTESAWRLEARFEGTAGTVIPPNAITIAELPAP